MTNSCIASERRSCATLMLHLAAVVQVHTVSCYSATLKSLDYF